MAMEEYNSVSFKLGPVMSASILALMLPHKKEKSVPDYKGRQDKMAVLSSMQASSCEVRKWQDKMIILNDQ